MHELSILQCSWCHRKTKKRQNRAVQNTDVCVNSEHSDRFWACELFLNSPGLPANGLPALLTGRAHPPSGVSPSRSDSQSDSQRSDGQLLLPVSGNRTDAPVPVPIEGGWGFPRLEQRLQVGPRGSISSDVDKAVFGYMVRQGSSG